MRISSITKNAGKACNNRLYRHIRTFEKIVKNYFVIYTKSKKQLMPTIGKFVDVKKYATDVLGNMYEVKDNNLKLEFK